MAGRAWGIKLGSGGICVPFCERYEIIGVGWPMVEPGLLARASRSELWEHVAKVCHEFYKTNSTIGAATGQLYRFGRECTEGDYVLYYDPPRKHVRIRCVRNTTSSAKATIRRPCTTFAKAK